MNYTEINAEIEFSMAINSNSAVLVYFSAPGCNVCKVLKPKILDMLESEFPKFKAFYCDIEKSPLIAGQLRIFTIPTLLVFFEEKEFYRMSRNISIEELKKNLERPYSMLF
jgi:thioredoxin 1